MDLKVKEGQKAPAFVLLNQEAKKIKLADYFGKPILVYFYPKDNTSGCTAEACAFRDLKKEFDKMKVTILGISPDSYERHTKFINKYKLNFDLLADTENKVAEKYGVWQEKSMYGRKYMGIVRSTFLINADGKIAKIWPKVKVNGHDQEVLSAIKNL